jgi:predicted MFS family arabinose efflux permease
LAGAAVAAFGFPASFDANAVSFLAVVAALAFIRLSPPPGSTGPLLRSMRDGLRAAWAQPSCRAATISIGIVAFLAAPFIALVPAVAHALTHGGATQVAAGTAALTTAQGAGAVAGALCIPPLALRLGRGRVLTWSLALLPLVLIGYGAAPSLWLAVAALFVVGMVYMSVLSGLQTVAQLQAPPAYRGRVLSFFMVALGVAYPIGSLAQGPVANHLGVGWTTVGSALLLGVISLIARWRWPGFVRAMAGSEAGGPGTAPEAVAVAEPAAECG